jgi:hypothetical protein
MNPNAVEKKPFSPPELTVYGNVKNLTLAIGNMGMADGGMGGTAKSQL